MPLCTSSGRHAEAEVAWYRGQMDEIDTVITESKTKRSEEIETNLWFLLVNLELVCRGKTVILVL